MNAKKLDITVESYRMDDFIVEIVENREADEWSAWIHHQDYGIKSIMFAQMFGMNGANTKAEFTNIVFSLFLGYAENYRNEFMGD